MFGANPTVSHNSGSVIPVSIRERTSLALDLKFIQTQGIPTTLDGAISKDDITITLTDATGFIDGNIIGLLSGTGEFYFGSQIGAAVGSVITLDTPIDKAFADGTTVLRATDSMNVSGSLGAPQIFQIGPVGATIEIDVTRVIGYIQDNTAMDDSKFGSLSALTNGIVFRKSNGSNQNYWNAKDNNDLAILGGGDLFYTEKAPAGSFGLRFRVTYGGDDKHATVIRLEEGDTLEVLIQDDLSTMEVFNMMSQGHVVDE